MRDFMMHHIIGLLLIVCPYTSGWITETTTTPLPITTSYPFDSYTNGYYYIDNGSSYNVSCSAADFPSFTLVMDTTGSMSYYLYQFQEIAQIFSTRLAASSANVTRQYTLMDFNDPSVGPLYVTCSSTEFFNDLYSLHAHDGGDCPEYSMVGLLKALEVSPFGSFVVLVTDASAKDFNDTETVSRIFSLIDSLQVRVFLFAGYCGDKYNLDFQIFKDIAARSYGHVFQIYNPTSTIADLLNFFLKIPINSTTRLFSTDSNRTDSNSGATFSVPSYFSSLVISVSGSSNSLVFYNPYGAEETLTAFFSESWGAALYLENPSIGIWTFYINATDSYSIRIEGYKGGAGGVAFNITEFCLKCDPNADCRKDLVDYTCVCKEGFNGNGFSCSDVDECNQWPYPCSSYGYCVNTVGSYNCTCNSGFTVSGTMCVDVDECLEPGLNNCDPQAVCVNYYGSYSCYCPEGYYGDGYTCEIDECKNDICGFGRECIKIPGSHICSDPCFNYTILNEPTRSTSYYYNYYYYYEGRSDYYLNGWYRFMGSGGTQLADYCPTVGSCYTRSPMWLDGKHPDPSDGISDGTICTADIGICCRWTSNVKIKSCPGGFYVYKFSQPPFYYSGYCTDPTTNLDSCVCDANEECKEVNGHYGCYCIDGAGPSALEDIRPVLTCGSQEIKASFQKCDLEKFNMDAKKIHLIDSHCTGFSDFNATNTVSVISILKRDVCGNELVNNGTNIIFKNTVFLSLGSVGGEDVLAINISCVYPLDMQLSLDTALNPFTNTTTVVIENTGQLQVSMALYQDSSYTTPYTGSEVTLTSKTNLYIGILLKTPEISKYAVQMTNCYAAPSINSSTRYDIIKNSCPSMQDSSINVIQNGVSSQAQFSVRLFGYVKNLKVVYLYCGIHICSTTCTPTCTGVRALSASDSATTDASLYIGPIYIEGDASISYSSNAEGAYSMVMNLATVLFSLTGTLIFTF